MLAVCSLIGWKKHEYLEETLARHPLPCHMQTRGIKTAAAVTGYSGLLLHNYNYNSLLFNLNKLNETLTISTMAYTVMILSFRTDMPGQTVQTQIRLLLEEQSDQGLHCLPFRLHRLDYGRAT